MTPSARVATGLVVSILVSCWAGMAAADPPLDMPSHATTLTGDEANEIRRALLPLVHDGKYEEAAKFARSELGKQWCDVAIEGRWKVDRRELRERFRLFGALTVLARRIGDPELAAECVITSSEYSIDSVRKGMALFELSLIARKMDTDQFDDFYREHLALECLEGQAHCCRAPHTFIASDARVWGDPTGADGDDKSGSETGASADPAGPSEAEKKRTLAEIADAWLRDSFTQHPTAASARRLLERNAMTRDAMVRYLRRFLPGRVPRKGPFASDDEAVSWVRDRSEARHGGELPDDFRIREGSWTEVPDKPWSTKLVTAGRTSKSCPRADGEWQFTSSYYYVGVRSASDGEIFVVPVMYGVQQPCGGYGTTPEPMEISWPNSGDVVLLTTANVGYVNDICGPNTWNDRARILCGGSSATQMRCLQVGSSRPSRVAGDSRFGRHYGVSVRGDGTLELEMNSKNPAPLAMQSVFEKLDGKRVVDIHDHWDELADRLTGQIVPDENARE